MKTARSAGLKADGNMTDTINYNDAETLFQDFLKSREQELMQ